MTEAAGDGKGRPAMRNADRLGARLTRGEIVLLDGALGTELERRGVSTRLPLWSGQALLDAPDRVRSIHMEYARAGADVLTAATFRTTPRTLGKLGLEAEADRLTTLAVALAREAVDEAATNREHWIAGSIAPLEDCYRPDLAPAPDVAEREHADQAERLRRAGVDLILLETMNSVVEAVAAARGAKRCGLPFWVSFIAGGPGAILSGEPLEAAVDAVQAEGPDAILVNCTPLDQLDSCLRILARSTRLPRGCYPNLGSPDLAGGAWRFDEGQTPERFAAAAADWLRTGVQIIGGCCGTGPAHIASLRASLPLVILE